VWIVRIRWAANFFTIMHVFFDLFPDYSLFLKPANRSCKQRRQIIVLSCSRGLSRRAERCRLLIGNCYSVCDCAWSYLFTSKELQSLIKLETLYRQQAELIIKQPKGSVNQGSAIDFLHGAE
jgi:hypothetical protein